MGTQTATSTTREGHYMGTVGKLEPMMLRYSQNVTESKQSDWLIQLCVCQVLLCDSYICKDYIHIPEHASCC